MRIFDVHFFHPSADNDEFMRRLIDSVLDDLTFDQDRVRRLLQLYPFIPLACAAIIGICINQFAFQSIAFWVTVSLTGVVGAFSVPKKIRWISICVAFVGLYAIRHQSVDAQYRSADIWWWITEEKQPAVLRGVVDSAARLKRNPMADAVMRPDTNEVQTVIEVAVTSIRKREQWSPTDGRVLVTVNAVRDELLPGDRVELYGSIGKFNAPSNPGAPDFREVYRRRNLHGRMTIDLSEQVVMRGRAQASPYRPFAAIATACRQRLLRHTTETSSPLAIALVTGQRDLVDDATSDLLLITGTAHLLSVSGLHLAIVVLVANYFASLIRLPRNWQFILVIVTCLCYIVITGSRPPVIRAAVLVGMVIAAFWMRRPNQTMNALAIAACGLLIYNPLLLFGIGAQLSFLAVGTLVICSFRDRAASVDEAIRNENTLISLADKQQSSWIQLSRTGLQYFQQAFKFSLAVTITSMPLVWNHFNVVSPISVCTNVILSVALLPALLLSIGTVLISFVSPALGDLVGMLCDLVLSIMMGVLKTAAEVPGGHVWLPTPGMTWVSVFYVVLLGLYFVKPNRTTKRLRAVLVVAWMLIGWMIAVTPAGKPSKSLDATFIDVGHGTAVILRLPDDSVWLYDCGRLGNDSGQSRDIDTALWHSGINHLDGVLLSHADSDHFNALPGLMRRFSIDRIVTPPGMLDEPETAIQTLRPIIDRYGIPIVETHLGGKAGLPNDCTVLHPPRVRVAGSDNANSLVLRIDIGGKTLLLPGDLEAPGTEMLLRFDRPPSGGVLMAPHHGSLTSDSSDVVLWARPADTVVSGGKRAARPEVADLLSQGGSGIHVTSISGAVRVRLDTDGKMKTNRWKENPW